MSRELTRRQNNESALIDAERMMASISQGGGDEGGEEGSRYRNRWGGVTEMASRGAAEDRGQARSRRRKKRVGSWEKAN